MVSFPAGKARGIVIALASSLWQTPLQKSLVTVIVLKILFLMVFWQLVLKHQAVHVDAQDMSARVLPALTTHAGENYHGRL